VVLAGTNVRAAEELKAPDEGSIKGVKELSLASRPSEIEFVDGQDRTALHGVVTRKAFLGEIVDYQIKVGDQFMRVQKGRRDRGHEVGEECFVHLLRPFWYRTDESTAAGT